MNMPSRVRTRALQALTLLALSAAGALAQTPRARIVSSANAFLASLDQKQRDSVVFRFDDDKQRARWSNLPSPIFHRAGIQLGALNPAQRTAAMTLLSSALSRRGYEKIQQIMDADEALRIQQFENQPGLR